MSQTLIVEPPRQPSTVRVSMTPLLTGAGTILATIVARWMNDGGLPAFHCQMLRWTGVPCPGCGGTRCLAACGQLDLATALRVSPLVAFTACMFLSWCGLALASPRLAEQVATRVTGFLTPRRIAVFVGLNWLYLCWALPR